jgi:hypothetical protein
MPRKIDKLRNRLNPQASNGEEQRSVPTIDELLNREPVPLETIESRFVYHRKTDEFYFLHDNSGWGPVSDGRVKLILEKDYHIRDNDEEDPGAASRFLRGIMKKRLVVDVVQIAGYNAGIHLDAQNRPFLVSDSTVLIEPVKGSWDLIRNIINGLLGEEQAQYFHAWMHWGLRAIREQNFAPGHYLIIMGPSNCGKTLLQEKIISPLFGCVPTDVLKYATGQTPFNSDVMQSFHLMISDGLALKGHQQRKEHTEIVKRLISNSVQRIEGKYQHAVHAPFNCRLSNTLNESAIESLPLLEKGMIEKALLFKAFAHPHLPTKDFPKLEFEEQIRVERSAYAYHLEKEFTIPDSIRESAERLGFRNYLNPEIMSMFQEDSREERLAEIFRVAFPVSWDPKSFPPRDDSKEDTLGNIWESLTKDEFVRERFKKLVPSEGAFKFIIQPLLEATIRGAPIRNVAVTKRKSGDTLFKITVKPYK